MKTKDKIKQEIALKRSEYTRERRKRYLKNKHKQTPTKKRAVKQETTPAPAPIIKKRTVTLSWWQRFILWLSKLFNR